jgi:hypothetical protein
VQPDSQQDLAIGYDGGEERAKQWVGRHDLHHGVAIEKVAYIFCLVTHQGSLPKTVTPWITFHEFQSVTVLGKLP